MTQTDPNMEGTPWRHLPGTANTTKPQKGGYGDAGKVEVLLNGLALCFISDSAIIYTGVLKKSGMSCRSWGLVVDD